MRQKVKRSDVDESVVPIPTSENDMQFSDGSKWIIKTLAQAKTIFGFGDAAYKNVGTTSGTIAAGDDVRFTTEPMQRIQLMT